MSCDLCAAGCAQPGPFCPACHALLPLPAGISPFAVFGLGEKFALDESALIARHRQLSRALHPDRFARASPADKRRALAWTTALNDALRALRLPEDRAAFLLRQRGIDFASAAGAEARQCLSPDFLEAVLEEREALFEARAAGDHAAAEALAHKIRARLSGGRAALAPLFEQIEAAEASGRADRAALEAAASALARLRYDARFLEEAEAFEREGLE